MQKIINFLNKRKICYIFIFAMIVCFFVSKVILQSFVILEAVKSINIFSKNASYKDSEPGSWKVSKSASWIDDGKARITINVDTISKNTNKEYKDVIIVLDISNTMKEDKLNKVKDATSNLVNSVLSDSNNKIALISSDVSELTNDKNLLINYINNLSGKDNISYYSSLDKVDDILRGYSKEKNRECIVLFLTDSYPNQGTPNQVGEYQYLEDNYPYVSFNGIQYEMGDRVLTSIKEISQHQYVANKSNLNDILSSFADSSAVYDEFTFIDYIDTNFFYIFSIEEIKAKLGTITLDGNKITWTINNQLISGRSTSMTIDINLKNGYLSKNRTFTTNKEEKIISKISGNVREDVTSNLTPILQNNFLIKYDANTPSDCVVKNNPNDEVGSVFANIKISDEIPMCIGYNFRGWEIITKNVKKINEDYFIMPESDVLLRGVWSKISIKTSMNGTVYEKNIELSSEQEENGSDAIKKDDSKDTDSKKINLNAKLIKQIDSTNIVFGKSLDRNSIASIIFVDSIIYLW